MDVPVPNSPRGLSWHKAELNPKCLGAHELCESRDRRSGLPVPNSHYGLCGRKATLEEEEEEG